jgi:hypothetical protein
VVLDRIIARRQANVHEAANWFWVRAVVTKIGWDGCMRRRALDTCGLTGAGRWEDLTGQVLAFPCRTGGPWQPLPFQLRPSGSTIKASRTRIHCCAGWRRSARSLPWSILCSGV